MIRVHEQEFTDFKVLHDKYAEDQQRFQGEYNERGREVVEIIREWERRLCGKMERGTNAVYSSKLAEKFWDEVRAFFPMIDYVGVTFK